MVFRWNLIFSALVAWSLKLSGSEKHFEKMVFLVKNRIESAIVLLIHAGISLLFSF